MTTAEKMKMQHEVTNALDHVRLAADALSRLLPVLALVDSVMPQTVSEILSVKYKELDQLGSIRSAIDSFVVDEKGAV